jgi:hypothetical protein
LWFAAHGDLQHAHAQPRRARPEGAERPHDPVLFGPHGCLERPQAVSVGMIKEPVQQAGSDSLALAGVLDENC